MASSRSEQIQPITNDKGQLELDLLDAELHDFPEEILDLKGLKVLKLPTDNMNSLPRSISMLTELEELYLHTRPPNLLARRVGLREAPIAVLQLKRLRVLSMVGNPMVPALLDAVLSSQQSNLVELEMINCGISQLPVSCSCTDLRLYKLDLSHNKSLKSFCLERIPAFTTLRVLKLMGCDLQEVPRGLGTMSLSNIIELDLSLNRALRCLPAGTCLGLRKLKIFKMCYCDIHELPADLSAMSDLETLDVRGNKNLQFFPMLACEGLKNLKVLNLSDCDIQELPEALGALIELEDLDVSGNKKLQYFPTVACASLKKLNLRSSGIRELPAELSVMRDLGKVTLLWSKKSVVFQLPEKQQQFDVNWKQRVQKVNETSDLQNKSLLWKQESHSVPVATSLRQRECIPATVPLAKLKKSTDLPSSEGCAQKICSEQSTVGSPKLVGPETTVSWYQQSGSDPWPLQTVALPLCVEQRKHVWLSSTSLTRITVPHLVFPPMPAVTESRIPSTEHFSIQGPEKDTKVQGSMLSNSVSDWTTMADIETSAISELKLEVGPEGGSASLGDMSLWVPSGAVDSPVLLSAKLYTNECRFPPVRSGNGEYIFSPVLSLEPHGYHFKQPVLVRCAFNAVPGGWMLLLLRANCCKPDASPRWEEIVVYNTDTGDVSSTDCSYDVSHALLSVDHFCDHCWRGKQIFDSIRGRKQLLCSAFGFRYQNEWTIEVVMHDRCDDIFEKLNSKQMRKQPPRILYDGPKLLSLGRCGDVSYELTGESWQTKQAVRTLPSETFWSDWFGNQAEVSFEVKLKTGVSKDDIGKMTVKVSTAADPKCVHLYVAPCLDDEFQSPLSRFRKRSQDSGMSSDVWSSQKPLVNLSPELSPDSAVTTHPDFACQSTVHTEMKKLDSKPLAARSRSLSQMQVDESETVNTNVIHSVADIGRNKWRELGRQLGFTEEELSEHERFRTEKEKLHHVLYDWTCKYEHVTIGQLLEACDIVGLGGRVRRKLGRHH